MKNKIPTAIELYSWLELLWIKRYQICVDTVVMGLAFRSAYWFTVGFRTPVQVGWWKELAWVILTQWIVIQSFGIHRILWRYISLSEFNIFVKASLWWIVPDTLAVAIGTRRTETWLVQASIVLLNVLLAFGGLLAVRVLWKILCDIRARGEGVPTFDHQRKRVVLIGAGEAGERALSEILHAASREFDVRGFVDDDRRKRQ